MLSTCGEKFNALPFSPYMVKINTPTITGAMGIAVPIPRSFYILSGREESMERRELLPVPASMAGPLHTYY